MNPHFRFCFCCLFLLLLTGCQAPDAISGKLILSSSHTLTTGSRLEGDLLLLGGTFTQQTGSTISGSIHITGGQAYLDGTVNGSVTLLDGGLVLSPEATVRGNLNILGGSFTQSPQARIDGPVTRRPASTPPAAQLPVPSTAGRFAHLLVEVPLLALVGALAARFYPAQMRILQQTIARCPLVCTASGLLAAIAGLSLAILMAYTLLLLPASFLLLGILLFATTFGAVPAATRLGQSVFLRIRFSTPTDPLSAGLGMALLAVFAELLRFVPFAGDLLVITLLLTALGAALLTRFGAQAFVPENESTPHEAVREAWAHEPFGLQGETK